MEILFFFLQLLLEIFGEGLLELALSRIKETTGRQNRDPFLAAVGYFFLGAILGAISIWVWPERLFSRTAVTGFSLLLSPVAGGAAMEIWGRFRRSRGLDTTNLATFVGGAALALGCAIVRFNWAR
jgi:hypothetical protein